MLQRSHQHPRSFDRRQPVPAGFPTEAPVTGWLTRTEDHALAFQHPGIAPPQRLGLAPGAVEKDDTFDRLEDRSLAVGHLTLARQRDDLAVGIEIGRLGR